MEDTGGAMTWRHVAIIALALSAVMACGLSSTCGASLSGVIQLATIVISGTLGHAGAMNHHRHAGDRDDPTPAPARAPATRPGGDA